MESLKLNKSRRIVVVPKKKNKQFEVNPADTHPSLPTAPKKKKGKKRKMKEENTSRKKVLGPD